MRRTLSVIVLLGSVTAGAVLGQDGPFEIKLKKAGPGDAVRETHVDESKLNLSVMGQVQKENEVTVSKVTFVETVIEKAPGAKKATKLKRKYEAVDYVKEGEKVDLDLMGKTVVIEKKGDSYTFAMEDGGAVNDAAREFLDKEFNKPESTGDEIFLPKQPVKVGESWDLDMERVAGDLEKTGLFIEAKKSKATGTLKKVYDKNGTRFGQIDVKMELVPSKVSRMGQEIMMKDDSRMNVSMTLDVCIDGTVQNGSGVITSRVAMNGEFMGVTLEISIDEKTTRTLEEVKSK